MRNLLPTFGKQPALAKTRDEKLKPEISAPGEGVMSALSKTESSTTSMSGTSQASPAVVGMIARLFGISLKNQKSLSIEETRELIIKGANKDIFKDPKIDTETGDYEVPWNTRYGYGRVCINSLDLLINEQ